MGSKKGNTGGREWASAAGLFGLLRCCWGEHGAVNGQCCSLVRRGGVGGGVGGWVGGAFGVMSFDNIETHRREGVG